MSRRSKKIRGGYYFKASTSELRQSRQALMDQFVKAKPPMDFNQLNPDQQEALIRLHAAAAFGPVPYRQAALDSLSLGLRSALQNAGSGIYSLGSAASKGLYDVGKSIYDAGADYQSSVTNANSERGIRTICDAPEKAKRAMSPYGYALTAQQQRIYDAATSTFDNLCTNNEFLLRRIAMGQDTRSGLPSPPRPINLPTPQPFANAQQANSQAIAAMFQGGRMGRMRRSRRRSRY